MPEHGRTQFNERESEGTMKKLSVLWTKESRRSGQPLIGAAAAQHDEEDDRRRMAAAPRHERLRGERRRTRAQVPRSPSRALP